MKALDAWITEVVGSASPAAGAPDALRWAVAVFNERAAHLAADWHSPRLSDESWRDLRARYNQILEDIELLESLFRLATGAPRTDTQRAMRPKLESAYGER